MPSFCWSDKYSVQIQKIDKQNMRLLELVNHLRCTNPKKGNSAAMGKALDGLIYYTEIHLKKEEELMSMYGFPEYEAHKSEHNDLTQKVEILQERYSADYKDIGTEIAILLNDWLAEHILVEDKKLGVYLNGKPS